MSLTPLARILIIIGLTLAALGGLLLLAQRLGLSWGNLPGDIRVEGENYTCIFALGTSILLSILLTLGLNLLLRILKH
ncbi:MAG: DUF2905 family protein [Chloroflexota bacterium]|nr:DUF2905 family protein [Chloroflexota bacterium]